MPEARVSEKRAREVGELLSSLGLRAVLELEERDPQREAALAVRRHAGPWAPVYMMLLALASYKLAVRGEEWWSSYARFLESRRRPRSLGDVVEDVVEFLKTNRGAVYRREEKIKRVLRASASARDLLEAIHADNRIVLEKTSWTLKKLAESMKTPEDSKTVVFAVKMAYYAVREPGRLEPVRDVKAIPVDVRVACATYASLLVDAPSYTSLIRERRAVARAWSIVSETSGIPMLHLDSLLWLTGWAPRDLRIEEAKRAVARILSAVAPPPVSEMVAENLYLRECR